MKYLYQVLCGKLELSKIVCTVDSSWFHKHFPRTKYQ